MSFVLRSLIQEKGDDGVTVALFKEEPNGYVSMALFMLKRREGGRDEVTGLPYLREAVVVMIREEDVWNKRNDDTVCVAQGRPQHCPLGFPFELFVGVFVMVDQIFFGLPGVVATLRE